MRMMHTKLPEFIAKLKKAGEKLMEPVRIRGLENLKAAKMQSLRTGRIENTVMQYSENEKVKRIDVLVIPRVPETMHTIIIKAYGENDQPVEATLDVMNIIHPTEQAELLDFESSQIVDNRPELGKH
jgi:hypothetical protein